MIPKSPLILATIGIISLIFTVPACATPIPVIIHGSVLELNQTGHTMTILPECDRYPCNYAVKGPLTGLVPNDEVFSRLGRGELVEAVCKQWINQLTDPGTGLIYPSEDVRDIHQWYAVGRLSIVDGNGTMRGTELFGDPAYLDTPLAEGYEIAYQLSGPEPPVYDYRSFPPETVANVTVRTPDGNAGSGALSTGENSSFSIGGSNTTLTVRFIGGYNAEWIAPKACPCADFHIRVISGTEYKPVIKPVPEQENPVNKTPLELIGVIAAIGFLATMQGLTRRR